MSVACDVDVREEIIKKNIPLVKYIASKIIVGKNKYVEYEDLISYGMIGLMDAINKYDDTKGMKFSTYAAIRINGSIIDEIRKNSPISKRAIDKLNKYNKVVEELQNKLYREPKDIEVAERMEISLKELTDIQGYVNYISMMSLETILFGDDEEMSLINSIEDTKSPSPQKTLEEKEMLEYLRRGLDNLKERDRLILNLYYFEKLTLKQIGSVLEVSESRVCQLHSRAILSLRKEIEKLQYDIKS
ncbi:RNA polymerase sigma factor [Clostridium sulfidigenes]|uniref:RNA polymerase sigma factor n=1 Tax=Clostridium sulfidigenes TaxID=318464 RepID=A0A084JIQ1_9CLOT|nr:FliA/WhiG family RNA polymerase sigma factor [Clostridium sulfidigenes]KEZ88835.1 RNA polymerase sigma factor [Clostridium sulfidigenes]HCO74836.1 FliA/WhiG family RNA polymerase sigma factor [Clostridium sp.]